MAQEKALENSAFDYLYIDRNKLSYLLAQLNDDGVATVLRKVSTITGSNGGDVKGNLKLISASAQASEGFSDSSDLAYDASWLLPSNILAVLEENQMLTKCLSDEPGQIVLIKGHMRVFDIDLVKRLWDGMTAFIAFEERGTKAPKKAASEGEKMKLAGRIVKELPPTIQFSLFTDSGEAWSLLDAKSMMVDHHGLTLKHGSNVQGEWHVLAIVDSIPGEADMAAPHSASQFITMMAPLMGAMRDLMGRPESAYGVTPLMIFRECR